MPSQSPFNNQESTLHYLGSVHWKTVLQISVPNTQDMSSRQQNLKDLVITVQDTTNTCGLSQQIVFFYSCSICVCTNLTVKNTK